MEEWYGYRKLIAWQRAMELAVAVDEMLDELSGRRHAALADQLRRAATSVAANIAEGNARHHRGDYLRFLSIARGSLAESRTLLEFIERRRLLTPEQMAPAIDLAAQTSRLLTRLVQSLRPEPTPCPLPPAP